MPEYPPQLDDMKALILTKTAEDVANEAVIAPKARHVSDDSVAFARKRLSEVFRCAAADIAVYIVGSAKLGYSLTEGRDTSAKPRFRRFSALSDIDVAVHAPPIFDTLWRDVSIRASFEPRLPWRHRDLGNYLLSGWWRPDHFPPSGVRSCDLWWELFNELTTSGRFSRHKVRGGMFYTRDELVRYQARAVADCRRALTEPIT